MENEFCVLWGCPTQRAEKQLNGQQSLVWLHLDNPKKALPFTIRKRLMKKDRFYDMNGAASMLTQLPDRGRDQHATSE